MMLANKKENVNRQTLKKRKPQRLIRRRMNLQTTKGMAFLKKNTYAVMTMHTELYVFR